MSSIGTASTIAARIRPSDAFLRRGRNPDLPRHERFEATVKDADHIVISSIGKRN